MSVGPIVFTTQGDQFIFPATISSIIWEGATTSGDRVELVEGIIVSGITKGTGNLLWPGRTETDKTYLGVTFGERGISAPGGFRAKVLMGGRLCIYLKEA